MGFGDIDEHDFPGDLSVSEVDSREGTFTGVVFETALTKSNLTISNGGIATKSSRDPLPPYFATTCFATSLALAL